MFHALLGFKKIKMKESIKVEVLLSTMHREDTSIVNKMNIAGDCLIINQTSFERQEVLNDETNHRTIRFFSYNERGLSISRNHAIKNSIGDVCLFADDDLVYEDNYIDIVREAYEEHGDADIIIFEVLSKNEKRYESKIGNVFCKIGYLKSMKVASFKISFKRKSVVDNDLHFDQLFGAGSKYNSGEENIFLFDCLKKKLKVYYLPTTIATVSHETSTWFKGFNEQYFVSKGAFGRRMFNSLDFIYILQFAIRKYKIYSQETSFFSALKFMFEGRSQYAKSISKK